MTTGNRATISVAAAQARELIVECHNNPRWSHVSQAPGDPSRYHHIMLDCVGGVTVDYEQRVFRGGWVTTDKPASTLMYAGYAWRERLVADAIRWLQALDVPTGAALTGAQR